MSADEVMSVDEAAELEHATRPFHVTKGWFRAKKRGTVCRVCGRRSAVTLLRLVGFEGQAVCLGEYVYCVDDGFVECRR